MPRPFGPTPAIVLTDVTPAASSGSPTESPAMPITLAYSVALGSPGTIPKRELPVQRSAPAARAWPVGPAIATSDTRSAETIARMRPGRTARFAAIADVGIATLSVVASARIAEGESREGFIATR
jgi:hypothetical protein